LINRNKKFRDNNWKVIVLNNTNISKYININEYPLNYNKLIVQHKADWIRLKVLQKYGGLWMDASIIINDINKLEEMYQNSLQNKSDLTGFYLKASIMNNDPTTYIENWFIMAPIDSIVIKEWLREFEYAINIGFDKYRNNIINTGYKNPAILDYGTYLTQHLCLQITLQNMYKTNSPNLLLYNAEDTMYKLHTNCNWNESCITDNLINDSNTKNIPYIKLRGPDRMYIFDMELYFDNLTGVNNPVIFKYILKLLYKVIMKFTGILKNYKNNLFIRKIKFIFINYSMFVHPFSYNIIISIKCMY